MCSRLNLKVWCHYLPRRYTLFTSNFRKLPRTKVFSLNFWGIFVKIIVASHFKLATEGIGKLFTFVTRLTPWWGCSALVCASTVCLWWSRALWMISFQWGRKSVLWKLRWAQPCRHGPSRSCPPRNRQGHVLCLKGHGIVKAKTKLYWSMFSTLWSNQHGCFSTYEPNYFLCDCKSVELEL